ncbi:MAG: NAD(P)H-dependent oxidoreductase [Gammaproteobacteria bacterium]|nr:NAD(P)H-dependent oxidoreductase [Gammaproteobacteria bacterium]
MARLLYVEASPRKGRSHSITVAEAFIEAYAAAHPGDTVDRLDLWNADLPRFDGAMLDAKYAILHGQAPSTAEQAAWGEVEAVAERFKSADKYLFSVPMWNFGLPYVMKHYIDIVTQPGLTFAFDPASGYSGLVSGRAVAVYASGGAYHAGSGAEAFDLQKPAFEGWLGFVGLTDVERLTVAPTLGAADDVTATVAAAVARARELAARF